MEDDRLPKKYKIVVTVPIEDADRVRTAAGSAGAGRVGFYDFCSFSSRGLGRYRPLAGSRPAQGEVGMFAYVVEERIEFTCEESEFRGVMNAITEAHPYDEPVIDVYRLEIV